MSQDNQKKDKALPIVLLLFAAAAILFILSMEDEKTPVVTTQNSREKIKGPKWEKSVNKHLFSTNERMEMERQKVQLENSRSAPTMWETKAQNNYRANDGVDLSTDPRGYEIADVLGRGVRKNADPQSPHEVVQGELFNEQQTAEYTAAYKEEYARQFVENAKRGGWDVRLSEDFRIISAKPIRRPTSQGSLNGLSNSIDSENQ